jgi:hypothetical protein
MNEAVYEQVVLELIEMKELELAKEIMRTTEPLTILKTNDPERCDDLFRRSRVSCYVIICAPV